MDSSSASSALIVFAKAPKPGRVKTRLTELLTREEAARLYEAFLRDSFAAYASLAEHQEVALRLYHADPDWPVQLTPGRASLHRQRDGGLDERMAAAFRETFATGASHAVIVGTDFPTLPRAFLRKAFEVLKGASEAICIGPTTDGGFYSLGVGGHYPQLFDDMSYSHAEVFAHTLSRAAAEEAVPVVLPEWYDVDRPDDLRRLAAELAGDGAACAPQTRRQMRSLLEKYPSLHAAPSLHSPGR